ncbi:MAG TPA: gamma-glutamyltransferase family protein [Candidatus Dormibacteraeota bacterium]
MTRGVIASPHFLASQAGAEVMREGGNAIDAALVADAVLCVVYPHMTSIGGDLFAMVWPAGAAAPVGYEGAGRAGSLASIEALREQGYSSMPPQGVLTVTVPGTVEAWGRLLETYGSVGLGRVVAPAVALARDGFLVTEGLSRHLHDHFEWLMTDPEAQRLLPPLMPGMLLRNPDLARSLELIGRFGVNVFYRGELGAAIADAIGKRGGLVTAADLATHRGRWSTPLAAAYRGLTVYEMPPPTQGLLALALLKRMERLDSSLLRPGPDLARELYRLRDIAYPLRDRYISDPDFVTVPDEPFLNPEVAGVGSGEAIPEGDTIYLCAADEQGNVVSLIQSVANSFGSGVIAEGTGILLQNRGVYFSLDPAHVNRLEPGKRTMHTLIPALASRSGAKEPWSAFGSMGADGQPQIQAQLFVNLADAGLDPAAAVATPRVRVRPGGGELWVEADYPGAGELQHSGLPVKLLPPRSTSMGHAAALVVEGPGEWRAGADPRSDGSVEFA